MISQPVKDAYYLVVARLSILNLWRHRLLWQKLKRDSRKKLFLHLGSGTHYIDGFVNVDGNIFRKSDLWLDLRIGLPFSDNSADGAYCCHTLEHFIERDVRRILTETFRVLKPGGIVRLVTPDLRKAVDAYLRNDSAWFDDFPDQRRSLGGRFNNYLLCADQHRLMFDYSFMAEVLEAVGFVEIAESSPHQSRLFATDELTKFEYETPERHTSLFIEAMKD